MKITFLGTGTSQGVPVIACNCRACQSTDPKDKRLRTSVLVNTGTIQVVIDSGPDFRQQMLNAEVRDLDAILFTHEHKDHIAGMDDVRAFNFINQKPVDVYAEQRVIEQIKQEFAYVFAEYQYPGIPQVVVHEIADKPFTVGGTEIIPIRVMHFRLPILGFRVGDFTYITDANHIEEEEIEKIKGTRYLVVNALRKRQHYSHFTVSEAIRLIEKIGPEQAYLTHISHQMGLHEEVQSELPPGISLAHDGLELDC